MIELKPCSFCEGQAKMKKDDLRIIEAGNCVCCGKHIDDNGLFLCEECRRKVAEYIDRQAAIKAFREHFEDRGDIMARVCEVILNDIPAADVRENVKGKWLHVVEEIEGTTFRGCRCSKCNYWKGMGIFNFCPNCGADMRGEKDGE